ncbi:MAG: M6 family metalloprotease domain-containing protein [Bacteroidetes bacterium]|nr:M6 family metalloprotease domain-containing protein [Bacteroidota bacterium]
MNRIFRYIPNISILSRIIISLFLFFNITLKISAQSSSSKNLTGTIPHSVMLAPPKKCFIKTMQDYKKHKLSGLKKGQANQLIAIQGTREVPVLLGKFSDTQNDPWNPNDLQKALFDGPSPRSTMKEYFHAMSYGQFNVGGSVSAWYTVSHPKSYYSTHGTLFDNPQTKEFLKEVLDSSDSSIDFRQFDNDGPDGIPNSGDDDGFVDIVFFVSIGSNGRSSDDIWPHFYLYSIFYGNPYTTNDIGINGQPILIDEYTIQNSESGEDYYSLPPTALFCHEFGHALGLPDLYDIDYSSDGIGGWGLMGYQSYYSNEHPVGMEAWSKYHLGWIIPPVYDEGSHLNQVIRNSYQNSEAYIIKKKSDSKYFLIENRRRIGFDEFIRCEGLLIWSVNESKFEFGQTGGYGWNNAGNADDSDRGVNLIKADNSDNAYTEEGDAYPGHANNHTLDRNSLPNSRDRDGFDTGIGITNIREQEDTIVANISISTAVLNSFLIEPQPMEFFNTNELIAIKGTADGTNFISYDLDIGEGTNPQSWTSFVTNNFRVVDSTLGYLNPFSISKENIYTIRLKAKDNEGISVSTSQIYLSSAFASGWPQKVEDRIIAHSIGVDDIDNDGKVEITAGVYSTTKSNAYLYMWTSDGRSKDSLLWPKTVSGNRISAPAFADLDRDGKKEIIFTTINSLYVLRSDGTNFPGWPNPISSFSAPVVSDIDGDGNLEIIASETSSPKVYAWRSNGVQCSGWPQTMDNNNFYGPVVSFSPVVSDLDNDGKCEIIQKNESGQLYIWNYDGQLRRSLSLAEHDFRSSEPIVADLDGNGQKEIITLCDHSIYVFTIDGSIVPGWPKPINRYDATETFAVSDINNDNYAEIILATDYVTVYDYQGNILPGWPSDPLLSDHIDAEANPTHPIAADINSDGEIEIIVVNYRNIFALSNKGKIIDGWPRKIPNRVDQGYWIAFREYTPIITDINLDGNIEIALGAENQVLVWELGTKIKRANTSWLKWQSNKWNTGEYKFIPSDDIPFTTGPDISHPPMLSLGNVQIGQSKDTTITINNLGNDTLRITSITSIRSEILSLSNIINIAPGKRAIDTLRFTPISSCQVISELVITSNTLTSPDTIIVSGIGIGNSGTSYSYKVIDFDKIKVGQFKDSTISITNTGNDTLKILSITSSNSSFSVYPATLMVAPQQTLEDTIRFAPTGIGSINSKIVIVSNAPISPDTIIVTGIGLDPTESVDDLSYQIPKEYSISQNYPNPFNANTIIRYGLPQNSMVRIEVFDILGRLVNTIVNGVQEARYYEVSWNKGIASGVYFYRMIATGLNDNSKTYIEVRRMVLLK